MRSTRALTTAAVVGGILFVSIVGVASAMHFTPWSTPVNAEAVASTSTELNTPFNDGCPIQSPDGLSLYMASNRPGGLGGQDIWVARRTSRDARWEAPENLGAPVNSAANDFCPTPRARGPAPRCGGEDESRDRTRPLSQPSHRRDARPQRPLEARLPLADGGDQQGARARLARRGRHGLRHGCSRAAA
jgi:hypothetical protein